MGDAAPGCHVLTCHRSTRPLACPRRKLTEKTWHSGAPLTHPGLKKKKKKKKRNLGSANGLAILTVMQAPTSLTGWLSTASCQQLSRNMEGHRWSQVSQSSSPLSHTHTHTHHAWKATGGRFHVACNIVSKASAVWFINSWAIYSAAAVINSGTWEARLASGGCLPLTVTPSPPWMQRCISVRLFLQLAWNRIWNKADGLEHSDCCLSEQQPISLGHLVMQQPLIATAALSQIPWRHLWKKLQNQDFFNNVLFGTFLESQLFDY